MANWYTSTRNGNDTTGNGTIAAPYATIFKAASLASTGDTINTEGDPLIDSGVTGTVTAGAATFTTSSSLTSVLSTGSIFTIDDPVWGTGTQWFKVRSITSTAITCNQPAGISGTFNIKYIATPSYSTSTSTVILEDLSTLTLDGINFEGGWNTDFTSQDRITWATYVTTSTTGNATFLKLNTSSIASNKSNLSFNKFGVGGNTMFAAGFNGASYNNLYSAYGNIFASGGATIQNAYVNAGQVSYNPTATNAPVNINNLYYLSSTTGFGNNAHTYKIGTFYTKGFIPSIGVTTAGIIGGGSVDVDMLNIDWQQTLSLDCMVSVSDDADGSCILRGVTNQGNYIGGGKKVIILRTDANAQVQIITTQNVDTWGIQSPSNVSWDRYNGFGPIKDIEGDKQFWAAGNVIFADASQFSTGSNSLRVSRAKTTDESQQIPIKSFYNADGTAKTITIKAKATTSSTVDFCIMSNGAYASINPPASISKVTVTVTDTWADYTLPLSATFAGWMEDSFINVGIISKGSWASEYVWIDSVTVA